MARRAQIYIGSVFTVAVVIMVQAFLGMNLNSSQWPMFFLLVVLTTATQLFVADAPSNVAYFASPVFIFAGLLLLEPWMFISLVVISNIVDWLKERLNNTIRLKAWYIQPFNVALDLIAGTAARYLYAQLGHSGFADSGLLQVINGVLAALLFVVINHILLGIVLVVARNRRWRETGMLQIENVLSDLVLLLLGYVVAVLWELNPWLIIPALSPLVLMYRALRVPGLEEEAQTDAKTGLLNARHFTRRAEEELQRAQRFRRPLSLIMADLDFLRTINNSYGHLAGDVVLAGIGKIIRDTIRDYDLAGRFGGEEFVLLLPESSPDDARAFAERLRIEIESTPFTVTTNPEPIHATMSFGIACSTGADLALTELTHEADIAVYQAKALGRNCVVVISEVPLDLRQRLISQFSRS
jgi:diguanylate cyclase (GGDEF)-like protein